MLGATFANDLLKLLLTGVPIALLADNAAQSPLSVLYLGLHTGDPGPAGTQETLAATYTGYTRVSLGRVPDNWTITANVARPKARIEFPEMTGGTEQLITWLTIGTAATGAGKVLLRGRLSPEIQCRAGVVPGIKAETTITFVTAS